MNRVYLEKIDGSRHMRRFYAITVTPTLFRQWAVVREWGRIGSPGTVREEWFDTEAQAQETADRVKAKKEKQGYCGRKEEALGL